MSSLGPLFKREFFGYFRSPVAYVFLVIFLLASVGSTFFLGGLYESNQASLNSFFYFLPWLFLVLVPAIGMRLWAEERHSGTIELLFTLPVSHWEAVLAKFLASWLFLSIAIILTFPLVLTVFYLGNPDLGVIVSSYGGAILMGGAFLAITSLTSSITKNQVISFILGVVIGFLMILVGWGVFTDILTSILPVGAVDAIASIGFMPHYLPLIRGVIDSRDVLYFLGIIGASLGLTVLALSSLSNESTIRKTRFFRSIQGVAFLVLSVACLSVILGRFFFRVDMTEDKVYSLSEGSLNIAQRFEDPVTIQLYFSKSLAGVPVMIKTYASRVEEVLKEYVAHSDGNIRLEVIDPKPDTNEEIWARKYGISGIPTSDGDEFYLGAAFLSAEKEIQIPYLDSRKEEFLEYDISEALVKLGTTSKPKLGIMSSIPVMGDPRQGPQGAQPWAFIQGLNNFFEVQPIELTTDHINEDIGTLVLIHPKGLSDKTQYAIDQFVVRGGRLIVAVDPFSRVDMMMSQQGGAPGQMPQASSDLPKLLAHWGVKYISSEIVGDPNRATRIQVGSQAISYPYFMSLAEQDLSRDHKISSQLSQMLFAESGSIAFDKKEDYVWEDLIKTSSVSGVQNAMMAGFMGPESLASQFKAENKQRTLAGLLRGKFKSAFSNSLNGRAHLPAAKVEGIVLIAADVDFLHDSNSVETFRFGSQVIMRPRNDNLNFLINAAEFMGGNPDLISIRSSGRVNRPFTKVLEIQQEAQKRWKSKEESLSEQLNQLQSRLASLQQKRTDGNTSSLSPEQQAEIEKFRQEEVKIRQQRREVRKNLREDIESLGHRLVALNMTVVPFLVILFAIFVFIKREKRARGEMS